MKWASLAVAVFVPALTVSTILGAGQHNGEVDKIQASVQYFKNSGQTTTNASGTLFDWGFGRWLDQSLVYVPAYWGTFPLYFVGESQVLYPIFGPLFDHLANGERSLVGDSAS